MRAWLLLGWWWGVGKCSLAPGTAASVATLPMAYLLNQFPLWVQGSLLVVLSVLGALASQRAGLLLGQRDHPSIVIDEVCGTLLALLGIRDLGWMAVGLLFFRALDILKPLGIRWAEALPGGWGVVADDLLAGAYARVVVLVLQGVFGP